MDLAVLQAAMAAASHAASAAASLVLLVLAAGLRLAGAPREGSASAQEGAS
jgi:hypothetical protein